MFVTRLVATWGRVDAGNRLVTRDDFDVIGDLLFLTNGLFRVEEPASKQGTALWLATQMGPMHETENPPAIEVMRVLSDRFQRSIESRVHANGPKVWPLTVITADALDRLSAVVQLTGERLDSILKSFHRAHPSRMIPLDEFMAMHGGRFNTEPVRALIKERFHAISEPSMQRFRHGDYAATGNRGASPTPAKPAR